MKRILISLFFLSVILSYSQDQQFFSQDISINKYVDGTLLTPNDTTTSTLAIIISDSGPTDRNGNQNFQKNNALKKLAESLSNESIATFRYDKRIVKQIRRGQVDPNISFDDFISDTESVIKFFQAQNNYSEIIIIGHGQGSLVGLAAALNIGVDQFISIAGSAKPINEVIIDQIRSMDPSLEEKTRQAFNNLKKDKVVKDYPQALGSIFSRDVQQFMLSWMKYHPQELFKELSIPALIINGSKDLQVPIEEAELLKNAAPETSELKIIENMNHVMFIIDGKELENSKSYNESFRPIATSLINEILSFIKG